MYKLKEEARILLHKGITSVADAVGATLGPKGRLAVIYRGYGNSEITKDGVSVAKEIKSEDPFEKIGINLIKEAALKTNEIAGDGTSSASVLTASLVEAGMHLLNKYNPVDIKKGFEDVMTAAINFINTIKVDVKDSIDKIEAVARIASNNDSEITRLIREAVELVGTDGVIFHEASNNHISYVDKKEGMEFNCGYTSPYFVTDPIRQEAIYENPLILVSDKKIELIQELVPIIEYCKDADRPLIIIGKEIEQSVTNSIVRNKLQSHIKVVCIPMSGFGDYLKENLKDLELFTGATLISSETGLNFNRLSEDHLGTCDKIVVAKNKTTFINGAGDKTLLKAHYDNIKAQNPLENVYNKGKYLERLTRLNGKVATIFIGAITDSELREKSDRAEDAINAVRHAIEGGVVPGGGSVFVKLLRAYESTDKEIHSDCLTALTGSFFKILENANLDHSTIFENVFKNTDVMYGFDVVSETYGNLWDMGILDTVKATTIALETAISISTNIISTEIIINAESRQNSPQILPFG